MSLRGSLPWGLFHAFTLLLENITVVPSRVQTLLLKQMQEFLDEYYEIVVFLNL